MPDLLRRNIEQAKHGLIEALSVLEHGEELSRALDDCQHAHQLLREKILPALREKMEMADTDRFQYVTDEIGETASKKWEYVLDTVTGIVYSGASASERFNEYNTPRDWVVRLISDDAAEQAHEDESL